MSDIYSSHVDNIPKAHKCLTKTATFKVEPDIDENLQNKFTVHKILYYFKVHNYPINNWMGRQGESNDIKTFIYSFSLGICLS